jgi:hypothetical protein
MLRRSLREHPGITVFDELDAGARRGHDVSLGIGECLHPPKGHFAPFGLEAAVVKGLPAAGLSLGKLAADAETLQQKDHLLQDIRKKVFTHAGDEQLYRFHETPKMVEAPSADRGASLRSILRRVNLRF